MNRYQILIEYEGTLYNGWQIQKKGKSIQENIEIVLSKLLKEKIKIYGSGRTDTGVHAKEQSAHFDSKNKIIQKLAMPSAAKLIEEKRIDINTIIGTGVDGRVTKGDGLLHLNLIKNNKLETSFVTENKSLLGKAEVDNFSFEDAEIGIYDTDQLQKL